MRKSLLSLIVAGILVLSGCAQIPSDSLVQVGSAITSTNSTDYTYYSPNGPTKGDGQTEILNGFLNAFTGPQDDYAVAREYLTNSLATKWNPTGRLLIETSRPNITYVGTDQAKVVVNAAAAIDAEGRYQKFSMPQSLTYEYRFTKENGAWRISQAPDATILVRPVFDVLFKSYNLYFYDQQSRYLIPDMRWFPTRPSTGTRLVAALLAGPSDWLAKTAHNTFPNGTKLSLESVPISDGTAVVDLTAEASKATTDQLQHMLAQLNATLTQVNSVYGTVIRVEHVPQSIADLPYRLALSPNNVPYMLKHDGLSALLGSNPVAAISPQLKTFAATDFAVNNQATQVALVGASGLAIGKNYAGSTQLRVIDTRPGLLRPAIDPQGFTFALGAGRSSTLKAYNVSGRQVLTYSGWLAKHDHVAFSISREGSRIAVLVRDGAQTQLFVAGIIRDYQGVPIGIGEPITLLSSNISSANFGWIGEDALGVITEVDGLIATPTVVTVGGDVENLPPITGAVEIVAPAAGSTYYVLDTHGIVWQLRGYTWQQVKTEVLRLHF
ncbi:MAG: LpqB family beta-propeller domain-containing protein [Micrococcales bacterium]